MNDCKLISLLRGLIPALLVVCGFTTAFAQDFVLETNALHPIFGDATNGHYSGCAWVDFDGDDDLDLFVVNTTSNDLYRNDGAGVFTKINSGILVTDGTVTARGTSWADYDNDGDLDCFISGVPSRLYQNDGAGNFTKIESGEIFTEDNRGWSSGWVDYDNDGFLDLVISHPAGFVPDGPPTPNHLYRNDGPPNYSFTKIDTGAVVQGLAPYTHGSWYDYDEDGDMDLFMASGPASSAPRPDYIYVNQLTESGAPGFVRLTDAPLATDTLDGQTWSIMDYDLDGDLDAFVSNWGQNSGLTRRNRLYRNDGGSYTEILDQPLATDLDVSLSNVWGDFDNDGDEDCFVANNSPFPNRYYINNGDGSFTRVDTGFIAGATNPNSGATVGDYDDDGDLDLFVAGNGAGNRLLYYNELSSANHWLKVRPEGVYSNRSSIGAVVRAKATIGGSLVWLRREVSASNSFMGHNMLDVHFGLGDAATVESLLVVWPSGAELTLESVAADQTLDVIEPGVGFYADVKTGPVGTDVQFTSLTAESVTDWSWDFGDGEGDAVALPLHTYNIPGVHSVQVDIQSANGPFQSSRTNYIGIYADTLQALSVEGSAGGSVEVQIILRNYLPLGQILIPFSWSGPLDVTFDGSSTTGLRSDFMSSTTVDFDPFAKEAVVRLDAPAGMVLDPGDGSVLTLQFTPQAGGAADSTEVNLSGHSGFTPDASSTFGPYLFSTVSGAITRNCCLTPGDADHSGSVNIADVTFILQRIFNSGPPPPCQDEGDADGGNSLNIGDATYLIQLIFGGGPDPICGTTGM